MKREKVLEEDSYAIFIQDFLIIIISLCTSFFREKSGSGPAEVVSGRNFYTEYYLLKSGIVSLPERAEYVKNPADLVFDSRFGDHPSV